MRLETKAKRNIEKWIAERCSIENDNTETRLCKLYGDYFEWCLTRPGSFTVKANFCKTLLKMGFRTKREKTARLLLGISLTKDSVNPLPLGRSNSHQQRKTNA